MKLIKCVLTIIEKNLGSIIIAIAVIGAAILYAYFNPYQSCKRDILYGSSLTDYEAALICSGSNFR